jgi:hypothetical protein
MKGCWASDKSKARRFAASGFYFRLHPLMFGERGTENTSASVSAHYDKRSIALSCLGIALTSRTT